MTTLEELSEKGKERFWSKIQVKSQEECWVWIPSKANDYGIFKWSKDGQEYRMRSHRLMWFITFGNPGDMLVCHSCDNPPCVNPKHLFLGTNYDNTQDMVKKNRHAKGFKNGFGTQYRGTRPDLQKRNLEMRGKLTDDDVLEIKRLKQSGLTNVEISKKFGVSDGYISRIISGKRRVY
jgi:hypothetical protein